MRKTVVYFDVEVVLHAKGAELYRMYERVHNTNPVVVCVRGGSERKLPWAYNRLGQDIRVARLERKADVLKLKEESRQHGKIAMLVDVDLDMVEAWGPTAFYFKI